MLADLYWTRYVLAALSDSVWCRRFCVWFSVWPEGCVWSSFALGFVRWVVWCFLVGFWWVCAVYFFSGERAILRCWCLFGLCV